MVILATTIALSIFALTVPKLDLEKGGYLAAPPLLRRPSSESYSLVVQSSDIPAYVSKSPKSPTVAPPPVDNQERIRIERDIRLHGGDYSILGKISVIQSDIAEMDNGEKQRQSIVRSSANEELVMVIEHFDRSGQFIHSSFHSAERVIASLQDKPARHRLRHALSSIGYSSENESGWHHLVIVRVTPDPEKIFELKNILETWVGSSGNVFLAGSSPK